MRIFISHSSKEAEQAAEICNKLEKSGHTCFLAPRDIRSGCVYAEEILNGIDGSDIMLLLLSREANDSPHVLREVERAVSKKKSIIVYKMEDVTLSKSMEYFLMTHQWVNFKEDSGFDEIIRRVNEYAAAHSDDSPVKLEEDVRISPTAEIKTGASEQKHKWIIPIIATASIVLAAGIIVPIAVSRFASDNNDISSASSNVSEVEGTVSESVVTSTASNPDTDSSSQVAEPAVTAAKVELGESVTFGKYNDEPIVWRVIRISGDGNQAVLLADKILTMKAYDAAESGTYNKYDGTDYWTTRTGDVPSDIQRLIRGDNRWEYSNIRTWLNSSRENVVYNDQAPTSKAMSELRNGYNTEAGFLNGFSKAELSALKEMQITTNGTATSDKVFLLSSEELEWLAEADVSIYAKPTAAAVEQDASNWYKVDCDAYGVDDFFWWLRDANPDNSCECKYINISYTEQRMAYGSVGLEGYGIRPAISIDLTSDAIKQAVSSS